MGTTFWLNQSLYLEQQVMTNLSSNAKSTTDASNYSAQAASFCFCKTVGDVRQRPSVTLQLSDLTVTA
jgi:hypothetical protein